jgi:hypothetical protein
MFLGKCPTFIRNKCHLGEPVFQADLGRCNRLRFSAGRIQPGLRAGSSDFSLGAGREGKGRSRYVQGRSEMHDFAEGYCLQTRCRKQANLQQTLCHLQATLRCFWRSEQECRLVSSHERTYPREARAGMRPAGCAGGKLQPCHLTSADTRLMVVFVTSSSDEHDARSCTSAFQLSRRKVLGEPCYA